MRLLQSGCEDEAAALAVADRRMLRPLLGRLWDPDPRIREHAASALGRSAEAHPELGLEIVRRLMWGLNDESATNGVYGIAGLAEIGRRCPGMFAPFVAPLASLAGDEGLRLEVLRALARIAEGAPRLVAGQLAHLSGVVDGTREEERDAFHRLVGLVAPATGENP